MIGDASGRLFFLMHPNHRDERCEGERDEERGESVIDQLDFVHQHDHKGGDEDFYYIESREAEEL